jgi:hypothetical protein
VLLAAYGGLPAGEVFGILSILFCNQHVGTVELRVSENAGPRSPTSTRKL